MRPLLQYSSNNHPGYNHHGADKIICKSIFLFYFTTVRLLILPHT